MAPTFQCAHLLDIALTVTVSLVLAGTLKVDANAQSTARTLTARTLYAVSQSSATRDSISVYDIDRGHNLLRTIPTVSNVDDVKAWRLVPLQANSTTYHFI